MRTTTLLKMLSCLLVASALSQHGFAAKIYITSSTPVGVPTATFGYSYCPSPTFASTDSFASTYVVCSTPSSGTSSTVYTIQWQLFPAGSSTATYLSTRTVTVGSSTPVGTYPIKLAASSIGGLLLSSPGTYYLKVKIWASTAATGPTSCTPVGTGSSYLGGTLSPICSLTVINPVVSITPSTSSRCPAGSAVTLTAAGSAGASFTWSAPTGGAISGSGATATTTPTVTGVYSVTAAYAPSIGTCGATATATVFASAPYAIAPSAASTLLCPAATTTLSAGVSTGSDYTSNTTLGSASSLQAISTSVLLGLVDLSGYSDFDNGFATVDLRFNFNFYGVTYNSINISANGYINFGSPSVSAGFSLPSTSAPGACVALFAHDLDPGSSYGYGDLGYTVTGSAPHRHFYVIYNNIYDYGGSGSNSGQIEINEDGTINMMVTAGTYTATQGVQNLAGTSGYMVTGRDIAGSSYTLSADEERVFTFTTPGVTYAWTTASGPGTLTGATTATPTTSTLTANTTYALTTTDALGCTATGGVTVNSGTFSWRGVTSGDWNTGSNWDCGSVPTITDDAFVLANGSFAPILTAPGFANHLTVSNIGVTVSVSPSASLTVASDMHLTANAAASIATGGELRVGGNLEVVGSVTGSGKVVLNGSSTQTISATGTGASMKTISNLELNKATGSGDVYIAGTGYDPLGITDALTFNTACRTNLYTNGNLTLVSVSGTTARIGELPMSGTIRLSNIYNNTTCQQFVPGGANGAYRFIGHPFDANLSGGLQQIESSGMDISGAGSPHANCFTYGYSWHPTAYSYDVNMGNSLVPSDPGWRAYSSACGTTGNEFKPYQGIRIYAVGTPGSQFMDYSSGYAADTRFAFSGQVNTGEQTVVINATTRTDTSTFTNFSIPTIGYVDYSQTYNMVGNPYPSPVNVGAVCSTAYSAGMLYAPYIFIYEPHRGYMGRFEAVDIRSGSFSLAANTAFQVRANPTYSGTKQLVFHESDKTQTIQAHNAPTDTAAVFRGTPEFTVIEINGSDGNMWDRLRLKFTDEATANEDEQFDAGKPMGFDFNFFSVGKDAHPLSYDFRPFADGETVPLWMTGLTPAHLSINVSNLVLPVGKSLYLHDKLRGKYVLLQAGLNYPFELTTDAQTQGGRFELAMRPASVEDLSSDHFTANVAPNPTSDAVQIAFSGAVANDLAVRIMNVTGTTVLHTQATIKHNGNISVDVASLAPGVYMMEIVNGSNKLVQKLVKE